MRVDEKLVADVWERQAFDGSLIRDRGIAVVFRGMPSDAGGPDYQDAILSTEHSRTVTGDVEFHALTSDWYRHGHQTDARYNCVILHVVWNDDTGVTEKQNGDLVPILALDACVDTASLRGSFSPSGSLLPHACVAEFRKLSRAEMLEHIRLLGLRRFGEKVDGFLADMTEQSPDQVLYRGLLEGLGYASNREVFRELSDIVPYWWLLSVPAECRTEVLLDAAGLGPRATVEPPVRMKPDRWRLARIRPTNHPAVRLRGIGAFLRTVGPSPADELSHTVCAAKSPGDLRRRLMTADAGRSLIGAGRADELAISVVLPFVAAYDESSDAASALYRRYPSAPLNRWTRAMIAMLAEAGHQIVPNTAPEHQGMHYLYHQFCRYERRGGCTVCARR